MMISLAIMTVSGLFINWLFNKFKLPGLLGMLLLGIAFGP
jgi:Kef-type K+ transport system membrane component KefB